MYEYFKSAIDMYGYFTSLYFHTWCGPGAKLRCRSEMCCTRLAENSKIRDAKTCQKFAICTPSHNFVGLYLRN